MITVAKFIQQLQTLDQNLEIVGCDAAGEVRDFSVILVPEENRYIVVVE